MEVPFDDIAILKAAGVTKARTASANIEALVFTNNLTSNDALIENDEFSRRRLLVGQDPIINMVPRT